MSSGWRGAAPPLRSAQGDRRVNSRRAVFPTQRLGASDDAPSRRATSSEALRSAGVRLPMPRSAQTTPFFTKLRGSRAPSTTRGRKRVRSEEHTSELQSPCNLVCRLLLEKKKEKARAQDRQVT